MSEPTLEYEPPSIIDWVQIALIAAAALFAALALGAVEAWSEQIVLALAGALALTCAVRAAREGLGTGAAVLVPIVLFVALAVVQLLPMPSGVLSLLSPGAVSLRRELLDDLPDRDQLLRFTTLSLYPEAGWHDFRLLLAVIAFFLAACQLSRSRPAIPWLLGAITFAGAAIACVSLGHQLFGIANIYDRFPPPFPPTRSAPFINHSHFAQFMNSSLGFALAIVLSGVIAFRSRRRARTIQDWLDAFWQGELRRIVLAGIAAAVIALACAVSGSRGGIVALVAAAIVTSIVGWLRGGMSRSVLLVPVAVTLVIAGVVFTSQHMQSRLAEPDPGGGRLIILRSLVPAWKTFPMLGAGLGSFEWIFPMYDQSTAINIYTHAENEYAQTLTETGVIGLAAVIGFVVILAINYWRTVRRGGRSGRVALGLGFGVVAVLVHSFSDFGQHIPANFILTSVAAGLIIGLGQRNRRGEPVAPTANQRSVGVVVAAFVAIAAIACQPQADRSRRAATAHRHAVELAGLARSSEKPVEPGTYEQMIQAADRAARLRPCNAFYRYHLNLLRWIALSRPPGDQQDDAFAGPDPAVEDSASLKLLIEEFRAARVLCPTFGPAYSMQGQLLLRLGDARGQALLAKAMKLAAYDGVTIAYNADLAMRAGDIQRGKALYLRACALQGIGIDEVFRRFINDYRRPGEVLELAGQTRWVLQLADGILSQSGYPDLARQARQRAQSLLQQEADAASAPPGVLYEMASVLQQRGDAPAAVEYLRRAVFGRPENPDWRLELARLLEQTGDVKGALAEAQAALRYRPGFADAAAFIDKVRARAATMPEK